MPPAGYDADVLAWSEEQAAMLRALPRASVPNGLDLENIADLGDFGERVLDPPDDCPFTLDELLDVRTGRHGFAERLTSLSKPTP